MGLVLVAALGATVGGGNAGHAPSPIWPSWLWAGFLLAAAVSAPALLAPAGFGRLLQPLTVFHPEWVGSRIDTLTSVLPRFRDRPAALAGCFGGAVFVQASIVVFFFLVAYALHINVQLVGSRGHRAALVHRPDAAGLGERIRRPRSDLRVLLHAPRPADRIGRPHVARRGRPHHALLALRRRRLGRPRPPLNGTYRLTRSRDLSPGDVAQDFSPAYSASLAGLKTCATAVPDCRHTHR